VQSSLISLLFAAKNSEQKRLCRRIPATSVWQLVKEQQKRFADIRLLVAVTGLDNERIE
jgi:hypothetical protein